MPQITTDFHSSRTLTIICSLVTFSEQGLTSTKMYKKFVFSIVPLILALVAASETRKAVRMGSYGRQGHYLFLLFMVAIKSNKIYFCRVQMRLRM